MAVQELLQKDATRIAQILDYAERQMQFHLALAQLIRFYALTNPDANMDGSELSFDTAEDEAAAYVLLSIIPEPWDQTKAAKTVKNLQEPEIANVDVVLEEPTEDEAGHIMLAKAYYDKTQTLYKAPTIKE